MAISQAQRIELHQELREKLTVTTADILMEHLPPSGWGDVATKSDIEQLRVATKKDLEVFQAETKKDLEVLQAQTKKDLEVLQAETKADLRSLTSEIQLLEARLTEKLDKTIIKQNRWMIGILGSLVISMVIALVR